MKTLKDLLDVATSKYNNNIAVTTKEGTSSYRQLSVEIGCIRGVLVNVALPKDKSYALLMSNTVDSVKTFLAIVTLGHTAVIIPEDITTSEINKLIEDFNIGCIMYDECFSEQVKFARKNSSGCIFISASNLFDEYVEPASNIDPDSVAVIMLTRDGIEKSESYAITHRSLISYTINDRDINTIGEKLKSVILLSVTRPLGIVRSFLSGLYRGGNLYFCSSEENMFSSLMYCKPDLLVLTDDIAEKVLNWLKRDNATDDEAPTYVILEAPTLREDIKADFESFGTTVFHEYFANDAQLLSQLAKEG